MEHYIRTGIPDEIPKSAEPSVVNHPTNHAVNRHNQSVRHQPVSTPIRMTNVEEPPVTQQSQQEKALLVSYCGPEIQLTGRYSLI